MTFIGLPRRARQTDRFRRSSSYSARMAPSDAWIRFSALGFAAIVAGVGGQPSTPLPSGMGVLPQCAAVPTITPASTVAPLSSYNTTIVGSAVFRVLDGDSYCNGLFTCRMDVSCVSREERNARNSGTELGTLMRERDGEIKREEEKCLRARVLRLQGISYLCVSRFHLFSAVLPTVIANGTCFTTGSGSYSNNERCTVSMHLLFLVRRPSP